MRVGSCSTHSLPISKVCLRLGCTDHLICEKCLLIHSNEHSTDFVDYHRVIDNRNGETILIKNSCESLKQLVTKGMLSLSQQQSQLITEIEQLTNSLKNQVNDLLEQKLSIYKDEIKRFYSDQQTPLLSSHKQIAQLIQAHKASSHSLTDEITIYQSLKSTSIDDITNHVQSATLKCITKMQTYINKSNHASLKLKLLSSIEQYPLLVMKRTEETPLSSTAIESIALQKNLVGHEDWVNKIAYLEAPNTIASASADGSIRIFDTQLSLEKYRLEGHIGSVTELLSWDEGHLLSGGMDKTVNIWDFPSQICETTLFGHDKPIRAMVRLSEDLFASAGGDRQVFIWSYSKKKLERKLPLCEDTILCLSKVHGDQIAAGSTKGIITIYDYLRESNSVVRSFAFHDSPVKSLLYLRDEKTLVSGSDDNLVCVVDYTTRSPPLKLTKHKGSVSALTYLNSTTHFLSAGWDGQINLWDVNKTEPIASVVESENFISTVAYLNDGKSIATGGSDKIVRVWVLKQQEIAKELSKENEVKSELENSQLANANSNCQCSIY